jgi:hypothetical protein
MLSLYNVQNTVKRLIVWTDMCDPWFKCRNQITLFEIGMHRHVCEISRITQRSNLSQIFYASRSYVWRHIGLFISKIINFTHLRVGFIGPFNIFTDLASQRLSHVCGFLLLNKKKCIPTFWKLLLNF